MAGRGFPTMHEVSDAIERARQRREGASMTALRFTEDEMRAMGNALDRAEIEVSEGDPLDSDDETAYLANERDVETAKAMWERIRATLEVTP